MWNLWASVGGVSRQDCLRFSTTRGGVPTATTQGGVPTATLPLCLLTPIPWTSAPHITSRNKLFLSLFLVRDFVTSTKKVIKKNGTEKWVCCDKFDPVICRLWRLSAAARHRSYKQRLLGVENTRDVGHMQTVKTYPEVSEVWGPLKLYSAWVLRT